MDILVYVLEMLEMHWTDMQGTVAFDNYTTENENPNSLDELRDSDIIDS